MGGTSDDVDRWEIDWPDATPTVDRLGDRTATRFRHFFRRIERLDAGDGPEPALFGLLRSAECLRDELREYEQQMEMLVRLAMTGGCVRHLQRLNGVLDAASALLSDANEPTELKEWEAALDEERAARIEQLDEQLTGLRWDREGVDTPIAREIECASRQEEVLTLLMDAICKYGGPVLKDEYRADGDDVLTAWEAMTTLRAFNLVARRANVVVMGLPAWFAAPFELKCMLGLSPSGHEVFKPTHGDPERLIIEAHTWSKLRHPHVATFLGACHVGGRLVLAHERIRPVREYVAEVNDRAMVWRRLYEVARGLQFLHDRGFACEKLDVGSVFCTRSESKAVLLGVGLVERSDTRGKKPVGNIDHAARWADAVVANTLALGVLALNLLHQVTPTTTAASERNNESERGVQFWGIPTTHPEFVTETEWRVVERIRVSAFDVNLGLPIALKYMREFLAIHQPEWLKALEQGYGSDQFEEPCPSQEYTSGSFVLEAVTVGPLVDTLSDATHRQRVVAVNTLRRLASGADNKVPIAAAGAISVLVSLLRDDTNGMKESAAAVLMSLIVEPRNRCAVIESGAVSALAALVRSGTDIQKATAAGTLRNLAADPVGCASIAATDAIDSLVDLLRGGTDIQKESAVGAVMSLAVSPHIRAKISAAAGVIESLVDLVLGGCDTQREVAAGALMNLTIDGDSKLSAAAAGVIAPLVLLVRNGSENQKANAAGALMSLAVNQSIRATIVATGAVIPLVSLVRDGTTHQKEYAAGALRNLSVSPSLRAAVAAAGAADPLTVLMIDGTNIQRENAASALVNLMSDADNRISSDASGVIDPFVAMARDGTDRQKTTAVHVMRKLTDNVDNLLLIAAAGAVDPLVGLVRDGTNEQREDAVRALKNLASNVSNAASMTAAGVIPSFVWLVRDGTGSQKEAAAGALMYLALTTDNKAAIATAGAIEPLVALVRDGTDGQKENAAGALMNLAPDSTNMRTIADKGSIAPLVALARDGTDRGKEYAAGALMEIAVNSSISVRVAEGGAIAPLVELVRCGTRRQKENAAGALRVLSYNTHNSVLITDAGAIDPLSDLLRFGSPLQRVHAASALKNLALPTAKMIDSDGFNWEFQPSAAPATSYWAI